MKSLVGLLYSDRSIPIECISLENIAGWCLPDSSYNKAANGNARKGVSSQAIVKKTSTICHEAYTTADRQQRVYQAETAEGPDTIFGVRAFVLPVCIVAFRLVCGQRTVRLKSPSPFFSVRITSVPSECQTIPGW